MKVIINGKECEARVVDEVAQPGLFWSKLPGIENEYEVVSPDGKISYSQFGIDDDIDIYFYNEDDREEVDPLEKMFSEFIDVEVKE